MEFKMSDVKLVFISGCFPSLVSVFFTVENNSHTKSACTK